MSRFHFIRQFKVVFGDTPIQFRTRMRLDQAKHLLIHSDDSITDICMAIGFSSLGSFSSLFSQRIGRAPSTYRQQFKETVEMHSPSCMEIMRGAWENDSQISRSAVASE